MTATCAAEYCFASTGDFGTGRKLMPVDVAKRAIDFVIERSGKRRNIEIDFFGGEPLMAMDTVKATVDYARELKKRSSTSTSASPSPPTACCSTTRTSNTSTAR